MMASLELWKWFKIGELNYFGNMKKNLILYPRGKYTENNFHINKKYLEDMMTVFIYIFQSMVAAAIL